ncbi:MAG: carboxypeptidase-like regulatory domain-containing protein [Minicystis sp.]
MRRAWRVLAAFGLALALFIAARAWRSGGAPTVPVRAPSAASTGARAAGPSRRARGHASEAGLVAVRGRVVADGGMPVGEAEVRVRRTFKDVESLAEVETDAAGGFEVFVLPGAIAITVTAPGFLDVNERARAPGDPITITLSRSAALVGRVVRADTGEAVAEAAVDVGLDGYPSAPVRTDADGRFRIDGLQPHRYKPRARAPGLYGQAAAGVWIGRGETSEEITIALHTAAMLRGRLELATTGAPCPGGSVEIRSELHGRLSAVANDAGEIVFPALLPGRYEALLACAGHATEQQAPPIEVGEAPLSVTFTVHHQLAITGVVVDAAGEPAEDVVIEPALVGSASTLGLGARTGSDGRFEVRGVRAGSYEIRASPLRWWGPRDIHPERVTVVEGAPPPEVRLVLPARHHLAGRVLDELGRPLARAQVVIRQAREPGGTFQVGDDGRFAVEGLMAGKVHLSVGFGSTFELPIRAGEADPTLPIDHEVTLTVAAPTGRIEGRVLRGASPAEIVRVEVRGARYEMLDLILIDAEGRFSAIVPPDAECSLSVVSQHGETAVAEHVKAGERVELRLRPAATVRGRVLGAPPIFRVWLHPSGPYVPREEVFFAKDGAWEMRGVQPGEMNVQATVAGKMSAMVPVTLAPGETRTIDLQLAPIRGDDDRGEQEGGVP